MMKKRSVFDQLMLSLIAILAAASLGASIHQNYRLADAEVRVIREVSEMKETMARIEERENERDRRLDEMDELLERCLARVDLDGCQ